MPLAAPCGLPLQPWKSACAASRETEWILPTSGTSGPPKLVVHTLRTLTGAIGPAALQQWATFYDIRRYGGLQIFLRALAGRGSLTLSSADESIDAFLIRLGCAGVTHISGTPLSWRSADEREARRIDPAYVRLSGEVADDAVLAALRTLYPRARIEHAYASTEAGVAFAVDDGKAGFPAAWLESEGAVRMRIVDGALQLRSDRAALRFLSAGAPALADEEGFVDTKRHGRASRRSVVFLGRRGGIINVGGAKVHPEEVEAALNAHAAVRASRVFARANAITGALVVAEVVLRDEHASRSGFGARNPRRLPRASARAHDAGAVALRRRPADHRGGKARAPWIISSSPAPAAASASPSPNAWRATVFASSRSPAQQRGVGASVGERRRGRAQLRARSTSPTSPPSRPSCARCARGSGRSTGWSTTPAWARGACSPLCATPISRR